MLVESENGVNYNTETVEYWCSGILRQWNTETVDAGKCDHFGLDYNWSIRLTQWYQRANEL